MKPSCVSSLGSAGEAETRLWCFHVTAVHTATCHSPQNNVCLQVGPEQLEFTLPPERSLEVTSFCL